MNKQHPLTGADCKQIQKDTFNSWDYDKDPALLIDELMRAAYNKGFSDSIECIREAGLAHYSALYEAQESFYKQQEDN